MQTGSLPRPCSLERSTLRCASGEKSTLAGAVDALGDALDLLLDRRRRADRGTRRSFGCSHAFDDRLRQLRRAVAAAAEAVVDLGRERRPTRARGARTRSISSSLSPGRRLTATTAGHAEARDVLEVAAQVRRSRARSRPARRRSLAAVVLHRAHRRDEHDRARLELARSRQTMSKNFSMPMSEPKPDSVTT